ncbi:MAG: hypothetical protein WD407_13490 [Rhodospirillales bacterium]
MNKQWRRTINGPGNEHKLSGRNKLFRQGEMVGQRVGFGGGRKALEQVKNEGGGDAEDDRPFPGAEFLKFWRDLRDIFDPPDHGGAEGAGNKQTQERQALEPAENTEEKHQPTQNAETESKRPCKSIKSRQLVKNAECFENCRSNPDAGYGFQSDDTGGNHSMPKTVKTGFDKLRNWTR